MTKSRGILAPRRYWTPVEIALLRSMYPECHTDDVAAWVGCSTEQCYRAAAGQGLHKSAEYLASDAACRVKRGQQNASMIATRFKSGLVPWNKGGHYVAGGRSAETRFKKGRRPEEARNYAPIGSHRISKDGALERKVTDDQNMYPAKRWRPVTRLVWEAAHGPVPHAHVVIFKPGRHTIDPALITQDALECVSRAELARRNHPRVHSPELARLVNLKGAITRQVNRIAREAEQRMQA